MRLSAVVLILVSTSVVSLGAQSRVEVAGAYQFMRDQDIAKNDKDPELRKKAIFWLGQSHDPRVQQFLLDLINK